jgi:hypothetical protein
MLKAWSYKQNKIEAEWKWETEVLITNKIEYIQQASSVMRSILKIRDTLIRTNRIQEKKNTDNNSTRKIKGTRNLKVDLEAKLFFSICKVA